LQYSLSFSSPDLSTLKDGRTPLHEASMEGNVNIDVVVLLLQEGADRDIKDNVRLLTFAGSLF
jgi:ankyrin repeat protein